LADRNFFEKELLAKKRSLPKGIAKGELPKRSLGKILS
jgi:hypothetical protein